MVKLNENYSKLPGSYLFAEVARRTAAFSAANPDADIIKLGRHPPPARGLRRGAQARRGRDGG